jgi:hypothetical protein
MSLGKLPAGKVGKLLVFESGKVKMQIGEVLLDVQPGVPCGFRQVPFLPTAPIASLAWALLESRFMCNTVRLVYKSTGRVVTISVTMTITISFTMILIYLYDCCAFCHTYVTPPLSTFHAQLLLCVMFPSIFGGSL